MEALYIMIPFTLLLSGGALIVCLWAIRQGQFDDIETPPLRILIENEALVNNVKSDPNIKTNQI